MDTRTKIVTHEQALAAAHEHRVRWVQGHFDPLLAEHVQKLRSMALPGERLFVIVTDSEAPLLPLRARAELVAALADVDRVVMQDGPGHSELDDQSITDRFVSIIVSKHRETPVP